MRLLHEEELSVILSLLDKPEVREIRISDEIRNYLDEWHLGVFIEEISNGGLIEIESVRISYENGGFMDGFLNSYSKLVKEKKLKEAVKLADKNGFESLNKTLESVKTISEIDNIIDEVLKNHSILRGGLQKKCMTTY